MTTWKAPVTQGYTHWTELFLQHHYKRSSHRVAYCIEETLNLIYSFSVRRLNDIEFVAICRTRCPLCCTTAKKLWAFRLSSKKSLFSPFWGRIKQASGDTHQVLLYFSKKKYFNVDFKLHQRHWRTLRHGEIQETGRHYCDLISSLCWKLSFPDGSQTSVLWTICFWFIIHYEIILRCECHRIFSNQFEFHFKNIH